MPSKRTRRTRQRRVEVPANVIALLSDREPENAVKYFMTDNELRAAWNQIKDEVLAGWIEELPGTRPLHWWRFSAPEPRRRLGGTGTPAHEVLANVPNYSFGIPTDWVSKWQADYYNGRSRDIHGEPIGTEYREGHFAGVAIDPEDPPRYESEAVYLERHGLLLPGEFERLTEDDFEPEAVEAELDEEDEPTEAA